MHRPYLVPFLLFTLLMGCGGDDGTSPPPPASDTTPPETINTLEVISSIGSSVTLSWRTPGDDGVTGSARQYDLRYSASVLSDSNWAAALTPDSIPQPQTAGEWVTHTLSDLPLGTWYLAIKTADEVPNWSGISNVVHATAADIVAPSVITDLAAAGATPNSVTLFWTAPTDEGATQRAAQYDLRRSDATITIQNWSTAIPITGLPIPGAAGTIDSHVVTDLAEGTTYYFALKALDESGNASALSNVIPAGTTSSALFRLTWNVAGKLSVEPSWSPDGSEIAFTVGITTESEIYRMPVSEGPPVRLTNNDATDRSPAWSPDGTKIAFVTDRGGRPELWVMNADGTDPQFVSFLEAIQTFFTSRAAWSPDGTRLVYMTGDGGTSLSPTSLWIIPATGGRRELLIAGEDWLNSDPAWSPDGTKIAYTSTKDGKFRIWVKPVIMGQPYQVTFADPQQLYPCWSPDGTTIAYASNQSGNLDIWTVPAAGGPPTQMISHPDVDLHPAWSPDGSRVAFSSNRSGQMEVWIKVLE